MSRPPSIVTVPATPRFPRTGGTFRQRWTRWRTLERTRHAHISWSHSHWYAWLDHSHELDQVCVRPECWNFPLHRSHPQPGPVA